MRRIGDIPTAEELDEAVGTCNSEISTATLQRKVVKQERKDVERMMLLAPLIRRDAYERYLIMHHFISELSSVWSSFLFFTLLLSLVSTGLSYYLMVHTSDGFVGLYLFAIAIETAMFVWPVWCVVRANSHVGIIKVSAIFIVPRVPSCGNVKAIIYISMYIYVLFSSTF